MSGDDLLNAALALLAAQGRDTRHVLSWHEYDDHIALVVEAGYKYTVAKADLAAHLAQTRPETSSQPIKQPPKRRRKQ